MIIDIEDSKAIEEEVKIIIRLAEFMLENTGFFLNEHNVSEEKKGDYAVEALVVYLSTMCFWSSLPAEEFLEKVTEKVKIYLKDEG